MNAVITKLLRTPKLHFIKNAYTKEEINTGIKVKRTEVKSPIQNIIEIIKDVKAYIT